MLQSLLNFTCRLRHCEPFHLRVSKSLIPVIVPMYLRTPDSSVSNIIRNRMPSETCVYNALLYLAKGITNSEGLALQKQFKSFQIIFKNYDFVLRLKCCSYT